MTDIDLATAHPDIRAAYLDVYAAGYTDGLTVGRRELEDELLGAHEVSAAIARQIADAGPYADLCDDRGDHDRAERHRALLRERGIA